MIRIFRKHRHVPERTGFIPQLDRRGNMDQPCAVCGAPIFEKEPRVIEERHIGWWSESDGWTEKFGKPVQVAFCADCHAEYIKGWSNLMSKLRHERWTE